MRSLWIAALLCSILQPEALLFADQPRGRIVKVGGIAALTGDAANFGNATKNGMTLAWERLAPELRKRVVLLFEDDRADPKTSVAAFKKLTEIEKADVLVNTTSGTSKALSPLARAIEENPAAPDINTTLHTLRDFHGALGTYSASGDNRFTLPTAIKIVTEGGFQKLH